MYVNIGGDISVLAREVSAIINLETVLPSQKVVTDFIESEDENNRLQYLTEDIPRTLVITDLRTYISSISSSVLQRRLENSLSNNVKLR
ncbi:MAG: DUF370 domain-containing protein [Clostridiales bacterium]|nr:DUF370 domain-containing protein [Clostridiales bacterium]